MATERVHLGARKVVKKVLGLVRGTSAEAVERALRRLTAALVRRVAAPEQVAVLEGRLSAWVTPELALQGLAQPETCLGAVRHQVIPLNICVKAI